MSTLHISWVRIASRGESNAPGTVAEVISSEALTTSGVSAQSGASPDRATHALCSSVDSTHYVTVPASNPSASSTNSITIFKGFSVLLPITTEGFKVAALAIAGGIGGVSDANGFEVVSLVDENGDPVDWLTPPSVILLAENTLPTTPWYYVAPASGYIATGVPPAAVTIIAADPTLRNYVKSVQISSEVLATAGEYGIRDGAGGSFLWRTKIGTAGLVNGREITFDPPLKGSANTLLEFTGLTASATGAVYINAQGYRAGG